ncbi:ATP-binding protein [Evansella clarkii]|uniref:ATP-binding protein n=1 Tax=Evansella clarkii TaxID=79879 RepID=UPI001FD2BA87
MEHREERKINLLLSQAQLPKTGTQPFQWEHIQIPQGIDRSTVLNGSFIREKENLILYGGVGTGKTYLATLISLNAIHSFGSRVKFFTVAALVNKLIEENQKGLLPKFMKQIEKLDLLVLDELGYILININTSSRKPTKVSVSIAFSNWRISSGVNASICDPGTFTGLNLTCIASSVYSSS